MVSVEKKTRFIGSSEEDLRRLVEAAIPKNTKKATTFGVGVFNEFCQEKHFTIDLQECSAAELNRVLCHFYRGLRTKNGEFYKKSSYVAARASVGRCVTVDLKRPTITVFQTPQLHESNRSLNAVLIENKLRRETQTSHKTSVLPEDEAKIGSYFSDVLTAGDPVKLSQFCWYSITTHFGLRAAAVQTQLKNPTSRSRPTETGYRSRL